MKLARSNPCRNRSHIDSESLTSVLRSGTAFMCWALSTTSSKPNSSSTLYTGFQVRASALHRHVGHAQRLQPLAQFPQVAGHGPIGTGLPYLRGVHRHHCGRLVHIQAGATLHDHFHDHRSSCGGCDSLVPKTLPYVLPGEGSGSDKTWCFRLSGFVSCAGSQHQGFPTSLRPPRYPTSAPPTNFHATWRPRGHEGLLGVYVLDANSTVAQRRHRVG